MISILLKIDDNLFEDCLKFHRPSAPLEIGAGRVLRAPRETAVPALAFLKRGLPRSLQRQSGDASGNRSRSEMRVFVGESVRGLSAYFSSLVHVSARGDALTAARHQSFIASHLVAG